MSNLCKWLLAVLAACSPALDATAEDVPRPSVVSISLDPAAPAPLSGRLLVFVVPEAQAEANKAGQVEKVDMDPYAPRRVTVAAQEIRHLAPGASVVVDLDTIAFPAPVSRLPAGSYYVQAVLDVDHDYNYSGREAGDFASGVAKASLGADGRLPAMTLAPMPPARDPWDLSHPFIAAATREAGPEARAHADPIKFASPVLSRFWGRPMAIEGWVLRPPGYEHGKSRYPTVYMTHGWSGSASQYPATLAALYGEMKAGRMPPMIWVLLGQDFPTGAHEFTDSVNNGPWGTALTHELIPDLERRYRMDGVARGRFLFGHSSGGWAALSLQTAYPAMFGGAWATSPDPSDFHDFTGPDIYAPGANVYRAPDGSPWPLLRDGGQVRATFEEMSKLERVVGEYGGQMASFEAVFSPRGGDGRPMPLYDRDTGAVDPVVAAYWRAHYDIAERLRTHWATLKPDLDGKLHVVVGTADTFYLDGSARRLKATLDGLGAKSDFQFLEGRTHFDLYRIGNDRNGLRNALAMAMYRVARPAQAGADAVKEPSPWAAPSPAG